MRETTMPWVVVVGNPKRVDHVHPASVLASSVRPSEAYIVPVAVGSIASDGVVIVAPTASGNTGHGVEVHPLLYATFTGCAQDFAVAAGDATTAVATTATTATAVRARTDLIAGRPRARSGTRAARRTPRPSAARARSSSAAAPRRRGGAAGSASRAARARPRW